MTLRQPSSRNSCLSGEGTRNSIHRALWSIDYQCGDQSRDHVGPIMTLSDTIGSPAKSDATRQLGVLRPPKQIHILDTCQGSTPAQGCGCSLVPGAALVRQLQFLPTFQKQVFMSHAGASARPETRIVHFGMSCARATAGVINSEHVLTLLVLRLVRSVRSDQYSTSSVALGQRCHVEWRIGSA